MDVYKLDVKEMVEKLTPIALKSQEQQKSHRKKVCLVAAALIGFMYVTGMDNIRDVIPFPRTPGNCEF